MKSRWGLIAAVVAVLVLPAAHGCQEKRSPVAEIPPPLPRYLSREHAESKPPAAGTGQETTATPEEVAEQIRDLEKVLARRTAEEADRKVRIALEVPMTAQEPIRRLDDGPPQRTPPKEEGRVALTAIKPVGNERAGDIGAEVPVPLSVEDSRGATELPPPAGETSAEKATTPVTLARLTKRYEALARGNPNDVEIGRTLRFLYFLSGEDEKGLEAIGGLSASRQKLWRDLMWTLIVARDRMPGASWADHAAEVLDALDEVRKTLAEEAPLELGEVRFCESILRFGDYTPVAVNRFQPGQKILLYSEVSNFVSTKEDDGAYHVRLSQRLSLQNSAGREVWRHNFQNIHDICRSAREDFFLGTTIPLPGDLPPGKYALKVVVEDTATSKSVGARLELEIIA
ncbi:MAG: hypothetical protein GWP05_08970, partial [Anaerolineaceae bacterium]|nr:hypothetical protein [Anaerolineaceae bacterium]